MVMKIPQQHFWKQPKGIRDRRLVVRAQERVGPMRVFEPVKDTEAEKGRPPKKEGLLSRVQNTENREVASPSKTSTEDLKDRG